MNLKVCGITLKNIRVQNKKHSNKYYVVYQNWSLPKFVEGNIQGYTNF